MAAPPRPPERAGTAPPAPHEGPRCRRVRGAPDGEAMAQRGGSRSAFLCFVHDQLPELERHGLPVARVADAVPYCSPAWVVREECRRGFAGGWAGRRLGAISDGPAEWPQVAAPFSSRCGGRQLWFVCRGRRGGIPGWQE